MFPPRPGRLIVSCQPSAPDSPLNAPDHMVAMAIAAEEAGATALRVESPHHVISVKAATSLPVIGLWKRADERGRRVITPDIDSARALAAAGADMIAIAATADAHPVPALLAQFIRQIREETALPVMADVSTVAEGVRAADYGADMVATTLSGYTPYSPAQDGPDLLLVRELAQAVSRRRRAPPS
jgi:N-acylglucosamine-6-phosphate 2-epimerase